jgi:hypothetical protein
MNSEEKTSSYPFPVPEGVRVRSRRFGRKPASPMIVVDAARAPGCEHGFTMHWEDAEQGLSVMAREQPDGRLLARVVCCDANLHGRAWLSVAVVGASSEHFIRQTIPLAAPDSDGHSGSADFGPFGDIVKELGPQLGMIVFLMV